MLLRHLGLSVRDPRRSADFYLSVVGLDGVAREEPWGYRIDLPDGFMMALIEGEPIPPAAADTVHFGCTLPDRDAALAVREKLQRAGVREIEWEDSAEYAGVKIEDPDGYVVELFYDIS